MDGDLEYDNFFVKVEEALGKLIGLSKKGAASENCEPEIVRAAQSWLYDLQFIN